jgi:hypothetical protein
MLWTVAALRSFDTPAPVLAQLFGGPCHLAWDALSLDVHAHSYTGRTHLAWVTWFAVHALLRIPVQETTARLRPTGSGTVAAC